jgi:hypothetical protein
MGPRLPVQNVRFGNEVNGSNSWRRVAPVTMGVRRDSVATALHLLPWSVGYSFGPGSNEYPTDHGRACNGRRRRAQRDGRSPSGNSFLRQSVGLNGYDSVKACAAGWDSRSAPARAVHRPKYGFGGVGGVRLVLRRMPVQCPSSLRPWGDRPGTARTLEPEPPLNDRKLEGAARPAPGLGGKKPSPHPHNPVRTYTEFWIPRILDSFTLS